jgi:hypothetical protein
MWVFLRGKGLDDTERCRVAVLSCLADRPRPFDRELAVLPESGLQRRLDRLDPTAVESLGVTAVVDLPTAVLQMDTKRLELRISEILSPRAALARLGGYRRDDRQKDWLILRSG